MSWHHRSLRTSILVHPSDRHSQNTNPLRLGSPLKTLAFNSIQTWKLDPGNHPQDG